MISKNDKKWQALAEAVDKKGCDGKAFVTAAWELYEIFEPNVAVWLGRLYDRTSGGFYYSNSGRDNPQFGPDVESTHQAVALLTGTGFIDKATDLPKEMQKKIGEFVCSLMDADDGYFYHPQWDRNMPNWRHKDARLGRDQNWSISLRDQLGFTLPYPTANERLGSAEAADAAELPTHLSSKEALIEYLKSFDWENDAYFAGNNLGSIASQILSAGLRDTAVDFMNSIQNKETGIWGNNGDYMDANALLKITGFYNVVDAPIPNAEAAARTAAKLICADMDASLATVCWQFNVWYAIYFLKDSLRRHGGKEGNEAADRIVYNILKNGADCVNATKEKIKIFKKTDGSFSYPANKTAPRSQGVPVAIEGTNEGDVNATVICIKQTVESMFWALELEMPPIFDSEDYKLFLSAIKL